MRVDGGHVGQRQLIGDGEALRGENRTVASVAAEWGYASESAFSAAFKRVMRVSPARYRAAAA